LAKWQNIPNNAFILSNQLCDFINKNHTKINFMVITTSLTTLYTQANNTKIFSKFWLNTRV